MSAPTAIQTELQCPTCAGQCLYDPARQALACTSCDNVHALESDEDAQAASEFPFDPEAPATEQPITFEGHVETCQTFGERPFSTGSWQGIRRHCLRWRLVWA